MAKVKKATKLVVVETNGVLGELGGISGPILNPIPIEIDVINQLLNRKRRVYEVDPKDPKNKEKRVLWNLRNLRTNNFRKTEQVNNVTPVVKQNKVATVKNDEVKDQKPAAVTVETKSEEKSDFIKK